MKGKSILWLCCLAATGASAQLPETDIYIAGVSVREGKLSFSKPENITRRKGYDNQPCFTPDGKSILYVAAEDTIQSDIYKYDTESKAITRVTKTRESEYSPSVTPDGKSISVVRVDKDKGQRFYTMPAGYTGNAAVVPGTDSIGYYCWLNDTSLAMFILGDVMTLQMLDTKKQERTLIASDIGRCLKLSPDRKDLYFVIKQNPNEWGIFSINIVTKKITRITETLKGSEDFAILPDGSLLMGSKGKLYQYIPQKSTAWEEVADFSQALGDFYRISVNAQGSRIALVAFTGQKP